MIGIKRDIFDRLVKEIENNDILILVGARQTGKTTILKQLQQFLLEEFLLKNDGGTYFINLEDPTYLDLLNEHPRNLLKIFPIDIKRKNYIFIDEIQYLKNPTNFLKFIYDDYKENIKLIVSGSSAFYIDEKFKDSLAGRKKIFEIRTLSFHEFLRFKGKENLPVKGNALSIDEQRETSDLYDEYMVWGGYPKVVLSPLNEKEALLQELVYSYIKKDIYESRIKQDEMVFKLLKILATQIGGLVNVNELSRTLGVSKTAIDNYLHILQKSYHLALIRPFYKNARKELTKMPKIYFYDTGLMNFLLNDFSMPSVRKNIGILMENAVFRWLLDKNGDVDKIKFWRTIQHNEVDFIVSDKEAYEVKSNETLINLSKYRSFSELYPEISITFVVYKKNTSSKALLPYEI
ncbi:hypothetical protein A3J90_08165 [candidate division WOR-1 bacterium RIFOXYC2_FULL_37_10]|uniref:AAA+ ATPase domain-containing protein n=1 Tax=candidate division WOR-1 bacterium RIFOXYB2_FULL_37_13 TaxID=1802579 RepID=A0A1F4SSU5_UNCSA|nr:MAG: hypothetical protein A2246_05450 [candidate division WOR-1 bacterium RIFOXYA2_FULL_37_7]OGC23515.1 MAG: hypothetical protein A2310_02815 [candidate division WOR-1 bacterium RIFOXYB2_FULL_37_13]OGC37362.1 MAG: hypothetical protein A3J90_08165 [candidate division WOR-1 bacterium RIFOXYC2_FULL_37_10]